MPSKIYLFILFTCFFKHASDSRHVSLAESKDLHRPKLSHKKIEEKLRVGLNLGSDSKCTRRMIHFPCTSKEDESSEALCKKNRAQLGENISENEDDDKASLRKTLHKATKLTEDSKLQQGINDKKINFSSYSIFSEENLIETDYQPPQKKSPIHN